MNNGLLIQVKKFLSQLESTQNRLWTLYLKRRTAVRAAESDEILRLAEEEIALTDEMKSHLAVRQQILKLAENNQLPSKSIEVLVQEISGDEKKQLLEKIERSKSLADKIRTESWIHWIVSQRSINHCKEMLDIIANKGESSLTYNSEKEAASSTGGVILDASI